MEHQWLIFIVTASICFVHGIRGHPINTWKSKHAAGHWLENLLPQRIPDARILTYGYDANVVELGGLVSNNRMDNYARNLLSILASYRNADGNVRRALRTAMLVYRLMLSSLIDQSFLLPIAWEGLSVKM